MLRTARAILQHDEQPSEARESPHALAPYCEQRRHAVACEGRYRGGEGMVGAW